MIHKKQSYLYTPDHNKEETSLPDMRRQSLKGFANSGLSPENRRMGDNSNESSLHLTSPPRVLFPRKLPFLSKVRIVRSRLYLMRFIGWNGAINLDLRQLNRERDCVRRRKIWIVTTRLDFLDIAILMCLCNGF
jgi:hypothetical protein